MEISVAIDLIKGGITDCTSPQTWADLGAGSGLFTTALSQLLPSHSTIIAIDNNAGALNSMKPLNHEIKLVKKVLDFVHDHLDLHSMDGILMANALHFSSDKTTLLKTIRMSLNNSGKIILVEYDTDASNPWVPYPVSVKSLPGIADEAGFSYVKKIGETPSIYNRAMIYAAVLR